MSGRQVIERVWDAPLAMIWELWTTPAGLSSWWGPRGFRVEVKTMDLRVGGEFCYVMHAESAEMAAKMEAGGRPSTFEVTAVYTAVEPQKTLAYDSPFGDEKMMTSVTFTEVDGGVKMELVIDASKPEMTGGAAMGWRSAIEKLAEKLAT